MPRNLRLMYAHAYQSYIWNHAVSARLALNRTKPIIGDLVLVSSAAAGAGGEEGLDAEELQIDDEDAGAAPAETDAKDGDAEMEDAKASSSSSKASGADSKAWSGFGVDPNAQRPFLPRVKVLLTEADVAAHTLADVVLPLPGHSVVFPTNSVAEHVQQMMARDGISLETFRSHAIRYERCVRVEWRDQPLI